MGVASGMGGWVDGYNTVRNWSVNYSSENTTYRASNTKQGTGRKPGNKDWTGSFSVYNDVPPVMPGQTFTFTGYGAESATGPAVCDSVEVEAEIEGNGILNITVNFSGNGAVTIQQGSGSDTSVPDPPSARDAAVNFNGSPLTDVRSWSLTISADNSDYRSSDTGGFSKRVTGPIDLTASVDVYEDDLTTLPTPGTVANLALQTDKNGTNKAFDVDFGVVDSIEPEVDAESGDPIGATISYSWSSFNNGTEGHITKPGQDPASTNWWPTTVNA